MLLLPRVLTARPVLPAVRAPRRGAWTQLRCAALGFGALTAMSSFAAGTGAAAAAPTTRHVRGGTIEVVPGAAQPYDSLVVISRESRAAGATDRAAGRPHRLSCASRPLERRARSIAREYSMD
jgi:hypothetical protein